jgi:hypothetical protein
MWEIGGAWRSDLGTTPDFKAGNQPRITSAYIISRLGPKRKTNVKLGESQPD